MGKVTGFLEIDRQERKYRPASDRIRNYHEFVIPHTNAAVTEQAARCMDCGIPFCHSGCPVNNQIPDWNDLVFNDNWINALSNLHSTNNFPEFTGRICPAPCEASCTLNITDEPVTIKSIECAIVDRGWSEGWIKPQINAIKTDKKVAVVGAGPAGLAAAQQLARAGHDVHLYEKNAKAGGLLRYGIPDFKMEKHIIDRRVKQMEAEGVEFHYNANIGDTVSIDEISQTHAAVILTIGAEKPRDLPVEGRKLAGVHFAMEFLPQQNRRVGGEMLGDVDPILANGKHVVVIGGGDTGSDCIGTSVRQGALNVTQLEIMPQPPKHENKMMVWPDWPMKLRTSSSHEEGAKREFGVTTIRFNEKNGAVKSLECAQVDDDFQPIKGSEFRIRADLVLLAMGFVSPVHEGLLNDTGIEFDSRGNILATMDDYKTSLNNVYSAGDCRRGQSLVVWAIREGRQAARSVDQMLMGKTNLPR
ncbi:MAG: glutamate synthase subunit beta [Hyphomicrobiales bacterium]|nr:glutamate synthase subunit beta [Hyphomicrobiales bacterium]